MDPQSEDAQEDNLKSSSAPRDAHLFSAFVSLRPTLWTPGRTGPLHGTSQVSISASLVSKWARTLSSVSEANAETRCAPPPIHPSKGEKEASDVRINVSGWPPGGSWVPTRAAGRRKQKSCGQEVKQEEGKV